MKSLALLLIRFYQLALSPWLGTHCRFVPSCSCYAREAYATQGVVRASLLTFKRLLRCHPFGGSGYDPVSNPKSK